GALRSRIEKRDRIAHVRHRPERIPYRIQDSVGKRIGESGVETEPAVLSRDHRSAALESVLQYIRAPEPEAAEVDAVPRAQNRLPRDVPRHAYPGCNVIPIPRPQPARLAVHSGKNDPALHLELAGR